MTAKQRRMHIFLDFDGTLTQRDTTEVLGSITSITGTKPSSSWNAILKAYLDDYNTHFDHYTPKKDARRTLTSEAAWLHSLRPIELNSVRRVEEAGVFRGVTAENIEALAKRTIHTGQVKLRHGWEELLNVPHNRTLTDVSILSVNWSRTFIREILFAAARETSQLGGSELSSRIKHTTIHANEIEGLNGADGSLGLLGSSGGIRTSGDKLTKFKDRFVEHNDATPAEKALTIYVGDSISDLECLATADIGICVRDQELGSSQRELSDCLERLGMESRPIEEATAEALLTKSSVWWAQDLASIAHTLSDI